MPIGAKCAAALNCTGHLRHSCTVPRFDFALSFHVSKLHFGTLDNRCVLNVITGQLTHDLGRHVQHTQPFAALPAPETTWCIIRQINPEEAIFPLWLNLIGLSLEPNPE